MSMFEITFSQQLAAVYNCDAYGAGSYDEGGQCATTTDTTTGTGTASVAGTNTGLVSSDGGLTATGYSVFAGIGLGVLLITIAIVLLVKRFRHKKS